MDQDLERQPIDPQKDPIQLIQKIVIKDRDAFGLFYDLYAPSVFGLILRIVKVRSDAEELLQDVFYYVWEKAANFDTAKGHPKAWLVTIARSRSIDRLRARARRPQSAEPLENYEESAAFSDNKTGDSIGSEDTRLLLKTELEKLTRIQKEVLELVYFEGLTQTEIAKKLSLPLGTVKTRVRDGLKHLKEIFGEKRSEHYL